jgi:hypothetical protein
MSTIFNDGTVFLTDAAPFDYTTKLIESPDGSNFLEVRGRFGHADLINGNKRIYPKKLWEKVLSDPTILESLNGGSMLGELDHPDDAKTSLNRVSHIITELLMEGSGEIIGVARILNNPKGQQLRSIFEAGGKVGISSRGQGSVRMQNGANVVQEDFKLVTFDFVTVPSTPNAFPKPVGEGMKPLRPNTTESQNETNYNNIKENKEKSMDSLTRLTELKDEATILLAATPKGSRSVEQLIEKLDRVQYQISRLVQEDSAISGLASQAIEIIAKKRQILSEAPESDFSMSMSMKAIPVLGLASTDLAGQRERQAALNGDKEPDLFNKGATREEREHNIPDGYMLKDGIVVDGLTGQPLDPALKYGMSSTPAPTNKPKQVQESRYQEIDIDAILAELEEEDDDFLPQETEPMSKPQTTAAPDKRISEAHNSATKMVIDALVRRVRELINGGEPQSTVSESVSELEQLREENARMRTLLEKIQHRIVESKETPAPAANKLAEMVEALAKKDPDAFEKKAFLMEATNEADLQTRYAKVKADVKITDSTLPPVGGRKKIAERNLLMEKQLDESVRLTKMLVERRKS